MTTTAIIESLNQAIRAYNDLAAACFTSAMKAAENGVDYVGRDHFISEAKGYLAEACRIARTRRYLNGD